VIPITDNWFAEYGIPSVLRTDNGPPFNGKAFREFSQRLGFKHRKITPYWPRANGQCERFMRNLEKVVKGAHLTNVPWQQELNTFLKADRSTPNSTTEVAPYTMLMGRNNTSRLPNFVIPPERDLQGESEKCQREIERMKKHGDRNLNAKSNDLCIGAKVIVTQPRMNKQTPAFEPKPYTVTAKKGTMVTACNGGKSITRNSSFFKRVRFEDDKAVETLPVIKEEESVVELEIPPTELGDAVEPRKVVIRAKADDESPLGANEGNPKDYTTDSNVVSDRNAAEGANSAARSSERLRDLPKVNYRDARSYTKGE